MLDIEDTVLYEQFAAARTRAIEITDRFNTTADDDPSRAELWEHVMRQTETARLLLERWLRSGVLKDQIEATDSAANPSLPAGREASLRPRLM